MSGVRIGDSWKTPSTVSVKVDNSWKNASVISVKVEDSWRTTTLGTAPQPQIAYVSTGVFEATNTEDGVYTTTLISGSGSVTQSTVNGKRRFSLSGANSRFSVTFSYVAGGPQSPPGFMERRAYTFTCRQVPFTCCSSCNCRLEGANCFCVAPGPGGCPAGCPPTGQCGCGGGTPCQCGSIGSVVCDTCCGTCFNTVCDVLVNQPGYTNSGTEWYKVT